MTQTSIPAGTLINLLNQAYDLHSAIAAAMNTIENKTGPIQPEQWDELHIAMQGAHIASGQLHQMSRRQRAADEPVPYTVPAGLDLPF